MKMRSLPAIPPLLALTVVTLLGAQETYHSCKCPLVPGNPTIDVRGDRIKHHVALPRCRFDLFDALRHRVLDLLLGHGLGQTIRHTLHLISCMLGGRPRGDKLLVGGLQLLAELLDLLLRPENLLPLLGLWLGSNAVVLVAQPFASISHTLSPER